MPWWLVGASDSRRKLHLNQSVMETLGDLLAIIVLTLFSIPSTVLK